MCQYNANDNLIEDLNKGIAQIKYNSLNLPDTVIVDKKHCIYYRYGGEGSKFRVIHKDSVENVTDYCGNVIYDNDVLHKVLTEEGFVTFENRVPVYHYFLQDHQGNNRMVIRQDGTKEEVNHYYPFGGLFGESKGMQKQAYKYNGKELDTNIGLNWHDYGARHYDAALGRWNAVDPMAEKYYGVSPYNYCGNNPILHIDPDGKDWYKSKNKEGIWQYSYSEDIHSQEELNKVVKNGTYLGITHTENNIYYSLFGSKKIADSFEGAIYQKIDNGILKNAISETNTNPVFGGEDVGSPTTDFSIEGVKSKDSKYLGFDTHRNEYNVEYEGSNSGTYNVLGSKAAMKAYMENWIGDRDMPKDIGGWSKGQKAYHIRFMNKKGVDILHLKYSKSEANTLMNKYNRLFLNRKK